MCGGRKNLGGIESLHEVTVEHFSALENPGMAFESEWTKHRKSLVYTAKGIRCATSFMPWSLKIPIGDGYHEFL